MMRAILALSAVLILFGSFNCRADGFVFQVDSPKFRISLPSFPAMKMEAHPMQASGPHFRFLGSEGPYTVSVLTPVGAAGMTPLECAAAILRSMSARRGLPERSQMYRARLNDDTFIAAYALPLDGVVRLNAHILSAAGGTHCIEVHASKMSESDSDLRAWIDGIEKATIEPGK